MVFLTPTLTGTTKATSVSNRRFKMTMKLRLVSFFAALFALTIVGVGIAQNVIVFDPATWFASPEAVLIAASLLVPWITKIITALGKDWFHTDGSATQWLSLAVAVVIAGVGGYFSLGYLAGVSGLQGALQAAFLVAVAFLGSNGMAKAERQVATSAVKKLHELESEEGGIQMGSRGAISQDLV